MSHGLDGLTRRGVFRVGLSVFGVAAVGVVSGCGSSGRSADVTDQVNSNRALTRIPPSDRRRTGVATGPDLDGSGTVSTGGHDGKIVVVNVWGSWCPPCRKEAPDLVAAYQATQDVASFVGLNVRDPNPSAPRAFVRANKIPYPSIYDPAGSQLLVFSGDVGLNSVPATLVIDQQQRSAARVLGVIDTDTLMQIITDVAAGR